jgi:hypothetical protein
VTRIMRSTLIRPYLNGPLSLRREACACVCCEATAGALTLLRPPPVSSPCAPRQGRTRAELMVAVEANEQVAAPCAVSMRVHHADTVRASARYSRFTKVSWLESRTSSHSKAKRRVGGDDENP